MAKSLRKCVQIALILGNILIGNDLWACTLKLFEIGASMRNF